MPEPSSLKELVNRIAAKYLATRGYGALVVGVYQDGNAYSQGFGIMSGTNASPPDAQTLFEIGSVTKVFTAIVLARLVEDGLLKLEDPIGLHLPPGFGSPKVQEIILKDLATHTSGLPRMPQNFNDAKKRPLNPYAFYTTQHLFESLATVELKSEPDKKHEYSNYGYGLLGKILELRTGKTYEQLIQEYVCQPLGLPNTVIKLSAAQKERLTPGHHLKGQILPNWDFDALAGCGALRSNAEDLLKFIAANLGKTNSPISVALHKTHERLYQQDKGGKGLGWAIQEANGRTFHSHSGATGGYICHVAFEKERQTGVVLLSNYGDAFAKDMILSQLAMKLAAVASKLKW